MVHVTISPRGNTQNENDLEFVRIAHTQSQINASCPTPGTFYFKQHTHTIFYSILCTMRIQTNLSIAYLLFSMQCHAIDKFNCILEIVGQIRFSLHIESNIYTQMHTVNENLAYRPCSIAARPHSIHQL